ncbi:MAG: hypothetical protein HY216_15140 [Candidatus Rokubacteria bacterium]|nr:hypothetical protein [Candidatus Rokubacteria bacterium]
MAMRRASRLLAPLALVVTLGTLAGAAGDSLDDLLMDLQVIPMERQVAKPFTLLMPDGKKLALADVPAPALLYFWATW